MTAQVADGAIGLDKNLKFAGSLNHCSIPILRGEYPKGPDLIRVRFFWSDYKWDNPYGSRRKETKPMRYVRDPLGEGFMFTKISCSFLMNSL
jgi:hypothetical protein